MCFRCGPEYHFITNCLKPDTLYNKVHWNTENPKNCAYRYTEIYKTPENSTYQNKSQKIYASMARMSSNTEITIRYFGDSSQLANWILDSGETCQMTLEISYFIPGSLAEIDNISKLQMGIFTAKQTIEVQIEICDNNGKPFIPTLYNVLLTPYLCNQLFSIPTLMNSEHTCLFHKGFCAVFFSDNE